MNHRPRILCCLIGVSLAALAAPDPNTQESLHGEPAASDADTQQFAARVLQYSATEIQAADVALARSHTDGIKDLAERLQSDSRTVTDELQSLMRSPTSSAASVPGPQASDEVKALRTDAAADFDRHFLDQTIALSQQAAALLSNAGRNAHLGNDLRAFAARLLPVVQAHLQTAQDLRRDSAGGASTP